MRVFAPDGDVVTLVRGRERRMSIRSVRSEGERVGLEEASQRQVLERARGRNEFSRERRISIHSVRSEGGWFGRGEPEASPREGERA
jgi:hypothetical protein